MLLLQRSLSYYTCEILGLQFYKILHLGNQQTLLLQLLVARRDLWLNFLNGRVMPAGRTGIISKNM
jgi:hypothetical protein